MIVVWVVEIDWISMWRIGINLIPVDGSEMNWFCAGVVNDLV